MTATVIAGVGRSGTTALFTLLAAAMNADGADPARRRFFYEPYLWNPDALNRSGDMEQGIFDTQSLHAKGIYVHTETPLFLAPDNGSSGAGKSRASAGLFAKIRRGGARGFGARARAFPPADRLHKAFIAEMLDAAPDVLIKVIRGNGRLQDYLDASPDLRIVGVLRNAFDTISSASNHFSFFGDEFYRSDKFRFADDVMARFGAVEGLPQQSAPLPELPWSALWWRYMTQALIEAKRANPDRVLLVEYNSFVRDKAASAERIGAFLGLDLKSRTDDHSEVGIVSKSRYLTKSETYSLVLPHRWYLEELAALGSDAVQNAAGMQSLETKTLQARYEDEFFSPPVVESYPNFRSVIGWRFAFDRTITALRESRRSFKETMRVSDLQLAESLLANPPHVTAAPADVSIVIPVYNCARVMDLAVVTALEQVDVRTQVILVDDCSDSETAEHAENWDRLGNVKLIRNDRNLGPGLSRHRAVMAAETRFVSTLDADDFYFPDKIRRELDLIDGDEGLIAVSNVEYEHGNNIFPWRFEDWERRSKLENLRVIVGRREHIPRDFLFARSLYLRTEGFEGAARMYEDWSFKIRLATKAKGFRATGKSGILYMRSAGGLSIAEAHNHLFHIYYNFLRNSEEIALAFGRESIALLGEASEKVSSRDIVGDSIRRIGASAKSNASLLRKFRAMEKACGRLLHQDQIPYRDRVAFVNEVGLKA